MLNKELGVWVGVFSTKRSMDVAKMQTLLGPCTWYVGDGEGDSYRQRGAANVVVSGKQMRSRNAVLEDAFAQGVPAVELSDDCAWFKAISMQGQPDDTVKAKALPCTFAYVVRTLLDEMAAVPTAHLAGVAPTTNVLNYHPNRPVSTAHFIVGDLMLVKPTDLRFDEGLRLKPDYDYTLQHLTTYGAVCRVNYLLANFAHYKNKGGVVDIRTSALMQETNAYLMQKWPGCLRDNPKRPDEILMRWKPPVAPDTNQGSLF